MVEKLDAGAYRTLAEVKLETEGAALPGVEIVPEEDSFRIKLPSNAKDKGVPE